MIRISSHHAVAIAIATFAGASWSQPAGVSSAPAATPAAPATPAPEQTNLRASDSLSGTTRSADPTAGLNLPPAAPGAFDLGGIGRRDRMQEEVIFTEPVSGLPLRMDNGIFIYPSVYTGVGYNSNVAGFSVDPNGSAVLTLQPKVVAELKKSGDRYTLTYNGNHTRYTQSGDDNTTTHEVALAGDNYFTARSRLGWSLSYLQSADPRGTNFNPSGAVQATPDRWHAPVAQALYMYGAKGAQGRIEVEGALQNKRYDNNRDYTYLSDVDTQSMAGRFLWRFMPKTHAVAEVRHLRSNYVSADSPLDNNDTRFLVGVQWDAAAKTTGGFKIGRQTKNFSSPLVPDKSGATWEGNVRWSPMTYSIVDFTTGRSLSDPQGSVGDYTRNTLSTLSWTHRWSSFISSRATLGQVQSEFGGTTRSDTTRNAGIAVFYEFGRNFRAGLEFMNTRRNSTDNLYDFRRNTTFLSLEGTL